MSYLISHHPHLLASSLARFHLSQRLHMPRPVGIHVNKKVALAVAVAALTLIAVATVQFSSPQSTSFGFVGDTCFSNPSILPGTVTNESGETFSLEQKPAFSIGGTPLYSDTTCITMHSLPDDNTTETLELKGMLGVSKTVEVSIDSIPQLQNSQQIDTKLSLKDSLVFTLDKADNNFTYVVVIDEQKSDCQPIENTISCPFSAFNLVQGQEYEYALRRHLGSEYTEIHVGKTSIVGPLTIAPYTITEDQTIFSHVSEISLKANKPITDITDAYLTYGPEDTEVPIVASLDDITITLTAEATLPRSSTFTLTIPSATAQDSGYLEEPFVLIFHTSGGPRVRAVDIETTRVPEYANINVTYNIGLRADQDLSGLVSLIAEGNAIDAVVSYSNTTVTINPIAPLPKCTSFTVSIADGIQSIHGITGGSAWSYTAKTTCYTAFSIGTSVLGNGITAYKFGSGAESILFVGGLHGSESSSVRTLNAWIDELEANYGSIPNSKAIVVIPNANPDAYPSRSRLNARGVDLNRNFPSDDWEANVYQPGNVLVENGGGIEALSEPESAALASYIQSTHPSVVLTYHAVARTVIANDAGNSYSLAQLYGAHASFGAYTSSYDDSIFEYPTTGELEAWLHDKVGIPALLVELATTSGNEIASQKSAMWAIVHN